MNRAARESLAEMEVEDRAVALLWDKDPHSTARSAVMAARLESHRWELEKPEMLKRNDPRRVYNYGPEQLNEIVSKVHPCGVSEIPLVLQLLSIFASLPVDAAAKVSLDVAMWAARRAKQKTL